MITSIDNSPLVYVPLGVVLILLRRERIMIEVHPKYQTCFDTVLCIKEFSVIFFCIWDKNVWKSSINLNSIEYFNMNE